MCPEGLRWYQMRMRGDELGVSTDKSCRGIRGYEIPWTGRHEHRVKYIRVGEIIGVMVGWM